LKSSERCAIDHPVTIAFFILKHCYPCGKHVQENESLKSRVTELDGEVNALRQTLARMPSHQDELVQTRASEGTLSICSMAVYTSSDSTFLLGWQQGTPSQ
jgi:hypothetical protein